MTDRMLHALAFALVGLALAIYLGTTTASSHSTQVMSPSHCWIDNYSNLHCYVTSK